MSVVNNNLPGLQGDNALSKPEKDLSEAAVPSGPLCQNQASITNKYTPVIIPAGFQIRRWQ
ncbi:MAG: hypothetical protein JWP57_4303 [Spirosoma sp.]|nr:hypothetical protein [Spirosoma sp.]